MAKTKKFTAIMPDGEIATRASKTKVYAFMVAARRSKKAAYACAVKYLPNDGRNFDYWTAVLRGENEHGVVEENAPAWKAEFVADCVAGAKRHLDGHTDRAAYVEAMGIKRIEAFDAAEAAGEFEKWTDVGWCSRRDLAEKLAGSTLSRSDYWAEARVCEAKLVA